LHVGEEVDVDQNRYGGCDDTPSRVAFDKKELAQKKSPLSMIGGRLEYLLSKKTE